VDPAKRGCGEPHFEILRRYAPQDEQSRRSKNSPTAQIAIIIKKYSEAVFWHDSCCIRDGQKSAFLSMTLRDGYG